MSRNTDYLVMAPLSWYTEYHIASLRPCPECRTRMSTTGKGKFLCIRCGFQDEQTEKVERIRAAGLAYASRGPNTNNRLFVKRGRGYRSDEETRGRV